MPFQVSSDGRRAIHYGRTHAMGKCALAIHGGCGVMRRAELPEADWAAAQEDLAASLRHGWAVLSKGGSAIDAVEAAVRVLEDSEHFNAGHGAVLNAAG